MNMMQAVNTAKANNQRYVELVGADACEMAHTIAKQYVADRMKCRGLGAEAKREAVVSWLKEAVNGWAKKFGRSTVDFISITGMDYRTGAPYKEKSYGAFRSCSYHLYKAC